MSKEQLESLRTTKTKSYRPEQGLRLKRVVFGGLLAILPALMAAKGCDVAQIGSDDRACGGLEGLSCDSGEFCKYAESDSCGAADATGVCAEKPELCTEIYAPVCGCDDETYGNECFAFAAGVSVASEGECDAPSNVCGGLLGEGCDKGEFCNYPLDAICGATDMTGVCEPKPDACGEIYAPVCGCDDQTYSNECDANAHGISVASEGECGDPSNVCGGLLGEDCDDGEFCNYPISAMCGAADDTGVCTAIPEACTLEDNPVCGCDDETYSNACLAATSGVSVAFEGECEPSNVCGGLLGENCSEGEFCNYPPSAICGALDETGVCEPIPDACDANYDPVCGCDDETYGNECEAKAAGMSITAKGECEDASDVCGGLLGAGCAEGEFCNYPVNAMCGATDMTGVCEPLPELCAEIYAPVCGCDDKTYDNECFANGAGVSVAAEGECDATPKTCGGDRPDGGGACDGGEFCNYALDAGCGFADETGVCEPIPEGCTTEYDPVCGCDGQTYGNECDAHAAGVAVASAGECETVQKACGGLQVDGDIFCPEGEFCNYPPDAGCGFADATGVCEPIPEECTTEYDPVCGCNGVVYGNECTAHAAGIAVNTTGDSCE